jgi:hypothetical protein
MLLDHLSVSSCFLDAPHRGQDEQDFTSTSPRLRPRHDNRVTSMSVPDRLLHGSFVRRGLSSMRYVLNGQARLPIHGPEVPACRTTKIVDMRELNQPCQRAHVQGRALRATGKHSPITYAPNQAADIGCLLQSVRRNSVEPGALRQACSARVAEPCCGGRECLTP